MEAENDENDNNIGYEVKREVKEEPAVYCAQNASDEEISPPSPPTINIWFSEEISSLENYPALDPEMAALPESSCPTSLDGGDDIWQPELLIDFQDELNIIAQDIFELKPANWDYLEEVMTEESTINYEKWMKSPAISGRDEMMPCAVGLNPPGSRRAATQELLNKARQKHRTAKDMPQPDLRTQKFYPGNYDKRMYRATRTVTFGSPLLPNEVVAESGRKTSSSSLPRVEYTREEREECRTKNIYRIHKRPKFKPKVTCVLENGEVGSLYVTLAEAEGISQPNHSPADGVPQPGPTVVVQQPSQTAGILQPSQTTGVLQPSQVKKKRGNQEPEATQQCRED